MKEEKNSTSKKRKRRRWVPALIIFGPALILILVSLGRCENVYDELPVFTKMPEYHFTDVNGNVISNETQKGRVTVFTTIQPSCPVDCAMDMFSFNLTIYQVYRKNREKFKNIDFVSIVTDKEGNPLNKIKPILFTLHDRVQKYDSTIWKIVKGDPKQVFSIENNGVNLYNLRSDSAYGGRPFLETILLVDKNNQLRYVGKCDKEGYVRDFEQKISLLRAEYRHKQRQKRENK